MSQIDRVHPEKFFERRETNETAVFMESKFNFLKDHMGLRPGCVHVIMATTGSGKSTLAMTLIDEMLQAEKYILVYSTEETVSDFETKMSYFKSGGNEHRLRIFHEREVLRTLENNLADVNGCLREIEIALIQIQPNIFILDNITTSLFYDQNERAVEVAMGLKRLCEERQIPFIIIAHTASSVTQNEFFESSKIRGYRSIVNTAQYVYCLMRLRHEEGGYDREISVIYTDKSRNHPVASRSFYRLWYDVHTRLFSNDEKIKYETFKSFLSG